MWANNENLEYCRYYRGEAECPYRDSFKGRAWMAEQLACERDSELPKDFLSFVAAHISKWEPFGYEPDVARYIAFFGFCNLEEKLDVARTYGLGDALQFQKPRGRTVFESHSEAGYFSPYRMDEGVLLYCDGSVYIKNAEQDSYNRIEPLLEEQVPCNQVYFFVGKYKETAECVKKLIKENREKISGLPLKIRDHVCDGCMSHYKFLSKHFDGYIYGETDASRTVDELHKRVMDVFFRRNTPCEDWFESVDVEVFTGMWGRLLNEIDAVGTRALVYEFIENDRFEEDCRVLGFEMDCFRSFEQHCHCDLSVLHEKMPEELFSACTDARILGNTIFSQWRYYKHRSNDLRVEFDTGWFRAAFRRLEELWYREDAGE